jgi:GT2 family glycosyltransferase
MLFAILITKSFKIYLNQTKPKLYEYIDTDFFCYKEDVDLAYRLRLFGFSAYTVPKARAWHDRTARANSASTIKNRRAKSAFVNYHSYKNHLFTLIKNVPDRIFIRCFVQISFYELGKFFYILLFEYKTLRSFKKIIGLLPKMIKKRAYIKRATKENGWRYIEPWLE